VSKSFPFVEVVWVDSAVSSDQWCEVKSLPRPITIVSRGWLVINDDGCIAIAASHQDEDNSMVGESITIPKEAIKSITDLPVQQQSAEIIEFEK